MPCSKYKGAQRRLCFATAEWQNMDGIKKTKLQAYKNEGGKIKMEYEKRKDDDYECPFARMKREMKKRGKDEDKKQYGPKGYWGI